LRARGWLSGRIRGVERGLYMDQQRPDVLFTEERYRQKNNRKGGKTGVSREQFRNCMRSEYRLHAVRIIRHSADEKGGRGGRMGGGGEGSGHRLS